MIKILLYWSWRILRYPFWLGLGVLIGFLVPYTMVLNHSVQERFNDLVFSSPTRIYARPLALKPGTPMTAEALERELEFSGYHKSAAGKSAGTWVRTDTGYVIASRGFKGPWGAFDASRVRVSLGERQISQVDILSGGSEGEAYLDPAQIATLYGAHQEERRIVPLHTMPPLLISGLQAVEDRHFNRNIGIDFGAIIRAAIVDIRAGRLIQGGSTLTQQLVRNLFLDRSKSLVRKFNEALLAVLIKTQYSKARILDAYMNEVFLGQHGNQAVHGFAAAAEFYFRRRVEELEPAQIALLVGLVRGPSYYNPRRYPERALARRNSVLDVFHQTSLLSADDVERAKAQPLGVAASTSLVYNRFPAFMDLVRSQVRHDFSESELRNDSLSVYTTLDPVAQFAAESSIKQTLAGLGERAAALQAAAVVTEPDSGRVLAIVGSREPDKPGFNRALDARRSVGSVIKPLVYLTALAQPSRWSLASLVNDRAVRMMQPNGEEWTPQNDDGKQHGNVLLLDALVRSYNLATVNLGMQVGIERISSFLGSFGIEGIQPHPSLLLGAVDLSPAQVTYLYQFIASGGHAVPLVAVSGVTDSKGKVLRRYKVRKSKPAYTLPVELTRYAMQEVSRRGTASAIERDGLGYLHAAGKTGTSGKQRDSWFAGFTDDRLAVFWMGRDDNKPTGLYGASGALVAWRDLFRQMPSTPLSTRLSHDIVQVWIDPQTGQRTKPECDGARLIPFIKGAEPRTLHGCFWDDVGNLFGD